MITFAQWAPMINIEYNSVNGSLIREIRLMSNDGKSLKPIHAIQLTSGQFGVSCHIGHEQDVVEVDINGQVITSYTAQLQSTTRHKFSYPRHLAVDKNNNCILVADRDNKRIVMLSRSLKCCAREFNVMSVDGGLQRPQSLHFDESQGRLFVGEHRNNTDSCQRRVLIFDNLIDTINSFQ
jgi:hypothetical protein